jgi:hypothetical protein
MSSSLLDLEGPSPKVQYVREDGSVIPEDELQELSPVNLLAAAVNMVDRDESDEPTDSVTPVDHDPGNRLNLLIFNIAFVSVLNCLVGNCGLESG